MSKLRLYTTIFVMGVGVGMASTYLTPAVPVATDRIDAASILTEGAVTTVKHGAAATAVSPLSKPTLISNDAPTTVTVPDGPLLRSATSAPPIDTSVPAVSPAAVRHEIPDMAAPAHSPAYSAAGNDRPIIVKLPNPEIQTSSIDTGTDNDNLTVPPVIAPAAVVYKPKPSKKQTARAYEPKRVEKLFLNPLGVR